MHPNSGTFLNSVYTRALAVICLLFLFLLGVKGLGGGFRLFGETLVSGFFLATENPFVGLVVGLLATTLVQSSSVTTSMIVALVAAPEYPLPLANAIPMIMGANIGTTVTNTLVSLAHMRRQEEFSRAFPVAICHDIFNYLCVLLLLPLEMATGFLQYLALSVSSLLTGFGGVDFESPLDIILGVGLVPVRELTNVLFSSNIAQGFFMSGTSALLIFFALVMLVKVLRSSVHDRVDNVVNNVLGQSALLSIAVGILVTIMVQSSSITTSVMIPLAGAGLLKLEQAFPVTIGANIGTTVTALLAAMAVSGPNASFGLQIALVHLFFNLSGLLLVYPVSIMRKIPLELARMLTKLAVRSRKLTVIWIAILFYGLPTLCIIVAEALR